MVASYWVSELPEDHPEHSDFMVKVEYTGRGRWAIRRWGGCLSKTMKWDYEPTNSERSDEWLESHRFEIGEALTRAEWVAKYQRIGGVTAADVKDKVYE